MLYPNIWNDSINIPKDFFVGSFFGLFTLGMIILAIVFVVLMYIYHSIAWYRIGKKQKYKHPWLSWIPFANISMIFQMGGFHWAWIFLMLIPIIGWIAVIVLWIISMWRIFEKEKSPGWFSLSIIIPQIGGILYLIAIGIVAWKKKSKPVTSKVSKKRK